MTSNFKFFENFYAKNDIDIQLTPTVAGGLCEDHCFIILISHIKTFSCFEFDNIIISQCIKN